MSLFHLLPACHHVSAPSDCDVAPHSVEILVVDNVNVSCVAREDCEIVAAESVVVVRHCVGEAPNNGLRHSQTWLAWTAMEESLMHLCFWAA